MATTNVINSTSLALYGGGTKVALSTDASISLQHDARDITNKDSAGWRELLEGLRSGSATCGGWYAFDATYGLDDLWTSYVNRTTLVIRFSTEVSGDTYYSGSAYISSLEVNSPQQEDNAAWTANFDFTGVISTGSVT